METGTTYVNNPEELKEIKRMISKNPLFYSLSEEALDNLSKRLRSVVLHPGESLFHEGDLGDCLYLIREGHVKVTKKGSAGGETVLAMLDAGEVFGEMALITSKPRTATITAKDKVELLQFLRQDFETLMNENPDLLQPFNKLITQRVSLMEDKVIEDQLKGGLEQSQEIEVDLPTLDLLIKLNEAAGGLEQVEHCKETANLAKEMSKILCPMVSDRIFFAAYLHEVGKVALSKQLVDKERRGEELTGEEADEFDAIWSNSAEILKKPDPNLYEQLRFLEHMGEASFDKMPLEAQILKVADTYQELVQYRNMDDETAIEVIRKGSGVVHNPKVVAALEKTTQKFRNLRVENQIKLMKFLNEAVDLKDHYTRDHSMHTCEMAMRIAEKLNLTRQEREYLQLACELHDVGKIYIQAEILNAPRKLSDDEYAIMKSHASRSADFFHQIPGMSELGRIVRAHHEKLDGRGYPDGLRGMEIPYLAKIMAIADVYSALTTPRVYRRDDEGRCIAHTPAEALKIMQGSQPGHFDSAVFEVFRQIVEVDSK